MLRSQCMYRRCAGLCAGTVDDSGAGTVDTGDAGTRIIGHALLPVRVQKMLQPRCWYWRYGRCSAPSASARDALAPVGARVQGAVIPSSQGRAGASWCLTSGKSNPKWGASLVGATAQCPSVPYSILPERPQGPADRLGRTDTGPGLAELRLGPRGAAYMHLIARGRGN